MSRHHDKFGFYQVGDLKFYNKLDAAITATRLNLPLKWNFNDDVFSAYDWSQEPVHSLVELYRQRAQQIRDSYDYVILWYSGGADSDNILHAFIDNNIALDEAACVVNIEADSNKNGYLNGEIYNIAVHKIQAAQKTQPWLKHTIIDICQATIDFYQSTRNHFDWVHRVSQYINPNYGARSIIVKTQPDWMNRITAGQRVAFIWGVDKPKIVDLGKTWMLIFRDVLDAACVTEQQVNPTEGQFDEIFYWTPDLPELIIKQAHVLKRFMKNLPVDSPLLTKNRHERQPMIKHGTQGHWLLNDGIHQALYPKWHPRPYQVKAPKLTFSPRDQWFFDLPDNDTAKKTWKMGLEYIWQSVPQWLKVNPNDIGHGLKSLSSRPYDIGA